MCKVSNLEQLLEMLLYHSWICALSENLQQIIVTEEVETRECRTLVLNIFFGSLDLQPLPYFWLTPGWQGNHYIFLYLQVECEPQGTDWAPVDICLADPRLSPAYSSVQIDCKEKRDARLERRLKCAMLWPKQVSCVTIENRPELVVHSCETGCFGWESVTESHRSFWYQRLNYRPKIGSR